MKSHGECVSDIDVFGFISFYEFLLLKKYPN